MSAAAHGIDTALAARKLGPTTVAKAAAKRTAKGVLHQWAGAPVHAGGAAGGSGAPKPGCGGGGGAQLGAGGGGAASQAKLTP